MNKVSRLCILGIFFLIGFKNFVHSEEIPSKVEKFSENFFKDSEIVSLKGFIESLEGKMTYEIHFSKNQIEFASYVKDIIDKESRPLLEYFRFVPSDTVHFLVKPRGIANGLATVFPANMIELYTYPPHSYSRLSNGGDWIKSLVLHELTHIIHMDRTTGFLRGVKNVFGSVGKMGGLAPRWFSEGIATWAESHFTNAGRLNSKEYFNDFVTFFLKENACREIGCLDNPIHFPHKSYPYLAGAYFMSFLEEKKSGTIRCIVEDNSSHIPFLLARSFKECVGEDPEVSFQQFSEHILSLSKKESENKFQNDFLLKNISSLNYSNFQNIDYSAGYVLKGKNLYFVEVNDKRQSLVKYNLESQEVAKKKLEYYIEKINLEGGENQRITIDSISPYSQNPTRNRVVIDEETLEAKESWESLGSYKFSLNEKESLFLINLNHRWGIYKLSKLEQKKFDQLKTKAEFVFYKNSNISQPQLFNINQKKYLGFQAQLSDVPGNYTNRLKSTYFLYDIENKKLKKVFVANENVEFVGQCSDDFVFFSRGTQKGNIYIVPIKESISSEQLTIKKYEGPSSISSMKLSDQGLLIKYMSQDFRPGFWIDQCGEILANFKKRENKNLLMNNGSFIELNNETQNILGEKNIEDVKSKLENVETYPGLSHLYPRYWYFLFGSNDNLSTIDVTTSIEDPFKKHRFLVDLSYYSKIDEIGPSLNYNYNFGLVNPGLFYSKSYGQGSFTNFINTYEKTGVKLSSGKSLGSFYYRPSIKFTKYNTTDFLSTRKSHRYSLYQSIFYGAKFNDALLQDSSFQLNVYRSLSKSARSTSFWGTEGRLEVAMNWTKKLRSSLEGSYGRLYKDDFSSGVLYAGGYSGQFAGSYGIHHFNGIPYGDAYGNIVGTGRFQSDLLLSQMYRGSGFTPLYLKDFYWTLGVDYLSTDFIFVDDRFLRDSSITSVYSGPKVSLTFAYFVDLEVELLYSNILNSGVNHQEYLLNVRGELF